MLYYLKELCKEVCYMATTEKIMFTQEEIARMEIQNFVNQGLEDVQEGNLYDFDEMFDEIERRYDNVSI